MQSIFTENMYKVDGQIYVSFLPSLTCTETYLQSLANGDNLSFSGLRQRVNLLNFFQFTKNVASLQRNQSKNHHISSLHISSLHKKHPCLAAQSTSHIVPGICQPFVSDQLNSAADISRPTKGALPERTRSRKTQEENLAETGKGATEVPREWKY